MKKGQAGFTFIEFVIAVAIFGIVVVLVNSGTRMSAQLFRQIALMRVRRDAQVNLAMITQDIRNSGRIVSVTPTTLVLRSFDRRLDFDPNAPAAQNIFNPVNIGTITYQFVTVGGSTYLNRKTEFQGQVLERTLLKDLLVTPDAANYLFAPDALNPENVVQVAVRLGQGWCAGSPIIYQTDATILSRLVLP